MLTGVYGRAQWHADRRMQEFAEARMDVHVDMEPIFAWNTKQVFFSVVARYQSPGRTENDVVIYDRIVTRDQPFVVLEDVRNKYGFREVSKSFRCVAADSDVDHVDFFLRWNIMPRVGWLIYQDNASPANRSMPKRDPGQKPAVKILQY